VPSSVARCSVSSARVTLARGGNSGPRAAVMSGAVEA
jgi:hypothetical protein